MAFLQFIVFFLLSVVGIIAVIYGLMRFAALLIKGPKGSGYKLVLKSTTGKVLPEIQATDFYKVLYQSDERYVLMVDHHSSPQKVVDELVRTYGLKEEELVEERYLHFPPGLSGLF